MKKFALALAALSLIGCVTAPRQYEFDNSRNFDSGMDEVWAEIISFFVENNLPISTIEQASGLIMSNDLRFASTEFFRYADCAGLTFLTMTSDLPVGYVNLFVRERSPGGVSVIVNTRFQAFRAVPDSLEYDTNRNPVIIRRAEPVECVSMGILENAIFDWIDAGLNMPTVNY